MYTESSKKLVNEWGYWLGTIPWDYFSTVTYKFDISSRRNETIMLELEKHLIMRSNNFNIFWIMEQTYKNHHTHNHLLIQGNQTRVCVDDYLQAKNLVDKRFVKHERFIKERGASFYVSKYINSPCAKYGIISPPRPVLV